MTTIPFRNLRLPIFYFTNRIGNGRGVVVIVLVYHAGDSGSIPCWGNILSFSFFPLFSLNCAFCNVTSSTLSFITKTVVIFGEKNGAIKVQHHLVYLIRL